MMNTIRKIDFLIHLSATLILLLFIFSFFNVGISIFPDISSLFYTRSIFITLLFILDMKKFGNELDIYKSINFILLLTATLSLVFPPLLFLSLSFPIFSVIFLALQKKSSNLLIKIYPTVFIFLAVWDNFRLISAV